MQLAGNYKLMRIKGADMLLFLDIQKIKLPYNENKVLIKNFLTPSNPHNLLERQASEVSH